MDDDDRYPGADHITVLRCPQVRTLSHWLRTRSLSELSLRYWGPAADTFRAAWAPLREYLDNSMVAPMTDNTMTRFLAWPHPALSRTQFIDEGSGDILVDAAVERLEGFGHVNLAENKSFMSDVSSWLGLPIPESRLMVHTTIEPRRRPDLATELDGPTRALLDHRSRLDERVWEHVARRVLPGADLESVRTSAMESAVERYEATLPRAGHQIAGPPDHRATLRAAGPVRPEPTIRRRGFVEQPTARSPVEFSCDARSGDGRSAAPEDHGRPGHLEPRRTSSSPSSRPGCWGPDPSDCTASSSSSS